MKSFRGNANSLVDTFVTLSQNSSPNNGTLGTILINEQNKFLLLKYFDSERTVTMITIGPQTLTTTDHSLSNGQISATLTTAWPSVSCQQLVVFSTGEQRTVFFVQNSTGVTWTQGLTGVNINNFLNTSLDCIGVQAYPLPANVSKVKNTTITIGQLVYTPAPVRSIQEWTKLNALPYTSSIPAYFYIYNNQVEFWPIPSASGDIITLNCQINVADMTYSDVTAGTLTSMSVGSNLIVGSGTGWTSYPLNVDLTFANLFLIANPPNGDGLPYQIQSFQSGTTATLLKPVVNAPNISGGAYSIGQYSLLSPDFHDTIVYGALRSYFTSIVKDPDRFKLYDGLFNERLDLMKFYLGTKSINVDLGTQPVPRNPNLFWQGTV